MRSRERACTCALWHGPKWPGKKEPPWIYTGGVGGVESPFPDGVAGECFVEGALLPDTGISIAVQY
jgi:hypothetical protein